MKRVVESSTKEIERGAKNRARHALEFSGITAAITFVAAHWSHPPAVYHMQFFTLSTIFTQSMVLMAKRGFRRKRPCGRDFSPPLPDRVVPLSSFVNTSKYADESFPSGDAAQAVVFAAAVVRHGWPSACLVFFPLLSAAGRVFFHAHHVMDVFMGVLIAAVACRIVHDRFTEPLQWQILCGAVCFFIILEKAIRSLTHSPLKKQ